MSAKRCWLVALWVVCCSVLSLTATAQTVTLDQLLDEMTNMEALTKVSAPSYVCKQFSSYDQRSTDSATATDENWFANDDRGKFLREEERNGAKEYVLMDVDGPGAIVRFWSANPKDAGVVRIYMDNAATPTFEASLETYLGGQHEIAPQPIGHMVAQGWNSYLPMPYALHCKVTASQPNFYYHINYRTYAPGTAVESFSTERAALSKDKIAAVASALTVPSRAASMPAGAHAEAMELNIQPGGTALIPPFTGPAALYELSCRVKAEDIEAALRKCVIEIVFDGQKLPAIEAPLGDFFGNAPGYAHFQSLPCGFDPEGRMYAHWVMPFENSASITLRNTSSQPVSLAFTHTSAPRAWTPDSLYFHAKWRSERNIPTRPRRDWNYVEVKGRGRFVGDMLHITNPVPQWWGEGDEKIYVDSEKFPSHFGTGSEDYYGYAWCSPQVFTHAYHNQPRCDGPANLGQTCVSRFHILDNIPFSTAFRFDIEVWHWKDCSISQSAVSYWYADAAATDNFAPLRAESLVVPPYDKPKRIAGALEGEELRVVSCSAGKASVQMDTSYGWSNAAQLWWRDGKPGDALELAFWVPTEGKYELFAACTEAPDYGIMAISVNGNKAGEARDFYAPEVKATGPKSLGAFDLRGGENILRVEITGCNAKVATPRYMFGIDYLKIDNAH